MKICIVIPTYNESRAIGELVSKIQKNGFDVLVIDDGSQDNTAAIAKESGAFVIINKENTGKGASLKAGFSYILKEGYDAAIAMDGDGQHDPDDIGRFIHEAEETGADLVVGNRMGAPMTMPLIRRLTNQWMSSFISKLSGQRIPDTQCGFRFIRRRVLEKVRLTSSKYETESEILIRAGRQNFKIRSIPIKSIYKGEVSTIHPVKDALRFLRLIRRMKREKRPSG